MIFVRKGQKMTPEKLSFLTKFRRQPRCPSDRTTTTTISIVSIVVRYQGSLYSSCVTTTGVSSTSMTFLTTLFSLTTSVTHKTGFEALVNQVHRSGRPDPV